MDDLEMQRTKQAVESEAAARSTRAALGLLAGELGVDIKDLDESQQNLVALRFVLDGRVTADVLRGIVAEVRSAEGGSPVRATDASAQGQVADKAQKSVAAGTEPPSAHRPYKFNSTEATEAKYRQRMAQAHRTEDARTGLYLVPRRPDPMPVDKPHPPCLVAARDGGTPCSRCEWLLGEDEYAEAWLDRDDDTVGRL